MAPAPTRSGRRPSTSSSSDRTRTLLIVGVVALAALAGYLLWRSRSTSRGGQDATSGTPGPDRTSSSLAPSGGAAGGDAGQLPVSFVSHPDQLQTQVQTTDAGGAALAEAPTSGGYSYVNPRPGQTTPDYVQVGSTYYQQSAPGSDYFQPLPPSHPATPLSTATQLPDAFTGTNVRRPGFQPDA